MKKSDVRLLCEPLQDWPYPENDLIPSPYSAEWSDTRDLLMRESAFLDCDTVILELDAQRRDIRQDGEPRANARLASGRIRVTMKTRLGDMRFAVDRFDEAGRSWEHNVRAVAMTLEAMRKIERLGALQDNEHYRGLLAIEAPKAPDLSTADGAKAWLAETSGMPYGSLVGRMLGFVRGMALDDKLTATQNDEFDQVCLTLGQAR